jgi:sugar/nucleoside kinase (ribokinase family)
MVQGCGDAFRRVTREAVEVVFCNEHEAKLYSGAEHRTEALDAVAKDCSVVFMTCGKDGSLIWDHGHVTSIDAYRVPVVDTTGAGDAYAAGVLHGLTHGLTPSQSARLGSFAAARVVAEMGPRLRQSLAGRIPAILDGAHPMG